MPCAKVLHLHINAIPISEGLLWEWGPSNIGGRMSDFFEIAFSLHYKCPVEKNWVLLESGT